MWLRRTTITVAVLLSITASLVAQFNFDPTLKWQTRQSAHFYIHYNQDQDSLARVVAQKAEGYYQQLAGLFKYAPAKIEIVLDFSNDYLLDAANVFPNNTIFLNPAPQVFQLGHYDDWLDLVIVHELTHAFDVDRVGGLAEIARKLIGRLYFPNACGPQWLIEGLATFVETELTTGGRGRDPFHDMMLRMAFLEDRVTGPNQNNVFLTRWPAGTSAYVYGQSYYQHIAGRYGIAALDRIRERFASNILPFQTSNAIKAGTTYGMQQIYQDWRFELQKHYQAQAQQIETIGLTFSTPITAEGYEHWSPVWSADGNSLYFVTSNPNRHQEISNFHLKTGQRRKIIPANIFENQMSVSSQYQPARLYFSKFERMHNYSLQNDIWMLDLASGASQKVTLNGYARHPAVHPSDDKIAYIRCYLGQTDLWQYDIRTQKQVLLYRGGSNQLFFNPVWSPDGKRMALSIWQKGGYQDIWLYELQDQKLTPLLQDKAWDIDPCWSNDGRYILFSSDRTGVYNLFAYDLETYRLLQITNVLGGAFDPAVSPNDSLIAFINYSAAGFDVHILPWHKEQAVQSLKALLGAEIQKTPLFVYGYSDSLVPKTQVNSLFESYPASQSKKYLPFRTLLPRFYLPLLSADEQGLALFLITLGYDVTNEHEYLASLQYGLRSHRPGYSLSYVNKSFYPILSLGVTDYARIRDKRLMSQNDNFDYYWERVKEASVLIQLPFYKIDTIHLPGIGWRQQSFNRAIQLAPGVSNPYYEGRLQGLRLQYLFSNAHQYPRSIEFVEGMTFDSDFIFYNKKMGSDLSFYQFNAGIAKYFRMPGSERQVLKIGVRVGKNNLTNRKLVQNLSQPRMRGFHPVSYRSSYYLGTLEYQFPILDIEQPLPFLPIFLQKFHSCLFADVMHYQDLQNSWQNPQSFGLELRLDQVLGYLIESRLRLGLAFPIGAVDDPGVFIIFEIIQSLQFN